MAWPIPSNFDGAKFSKRYGLDAFRDFYVVDGMLHLRAGLILPDDPPIMEQTDPVIPSPAGIWVHEMKALSKKQGTKLLDGDGTTCFHIVVEAESKLSNPWFNGITIDTGSTAFLMDKSKTVVWDGTKWK